MRRKILKKRLLVTLVMVTGLVLVGLIIGLSVLMHQALSRDRLAEPRSRYTWVGSTTIDVSDSTLNQMTGLNREKLIRYLSSSAAWHVTQFDPSDRDENIRGKLAAIKRGREAERWMASSFATGYISNFSQDVRQARILLRLQESASKPYRGLHQTTVAGSKSVELKLYDPDYVRPTYQSYLVIKGKEGVSMELFEEARSPNRVFTRSTIPEVNATLRKVLDSKFSDSEGLDFSILESGSTQQNGTAEVEISDGYQPGIYRVQGYVNPRQKGYIFLKVINQETKQEVLLPKEQKYTVEYIGWSSDVMDQFNFNVEAFCKRGDWSHEFPAEFQVWFHPDNGDPERKLLAKQARIYGWQR